MKIASCNPVQGLADIRGSNPGSENRRNRRIFPVAERRGQSRLTEPLADAQFQQRERVFVAPIRPLRELGYVSVLQRISRLPPGDSTGRGTLGELALMPVD